MKLSAFRFKDEGTLIHTLDPRAKIVLIAGLSSVLIFADFWQIALVGLLVILSGWIGKVNLIKSFWETRIFLALLIFIFSIHALFTPGNPLFSLWKLEMTAEGIIYGGKIVSRLILIVSLGFVYSSTTPPEGTRAAFEWFLRPLPINEKVLGTSASIGIRFFPMVVEEAQRVQEAQKARCIEGAGILRRLKSVVSPLLVRAFKRAEKISLAMDARCYNTEHPSPLRLDTSFRDHITLIAVLMFVAFLHLSMIW
ncbi:MAG: energy-coupling factor transporter transmembrane component T family protein [Candidatus Hadarchaeaceae archaeon]